jgi:hypothetical protein
MAPSWVPLGAHDRRPAFAREGEQPLELKAPAVTYPEPAWTGPINVCGINVHGIADRTRGA